MKLFRSLRRRRKTWRLGDAHGEWMEARWAPAASEAGNHRFVALQPIFDRRRKVFGYEALSRSKWENRFTGDPDTATRTMIDDWLLHGLDELTGGSRTFVNCTFEALTEGSFTLLSHAHRAGTAGNRRAQPGSGVRLPQNESSRLSDRS